MRISDWSSDVCSSDLTSVGDPTKNAPVVRDAGLLHFHDATTIRFAEKAAAANVDGIVCICAGCGARAATVSHLAFVPTVRSMFDVTTVLAGRVSTGADIRRSEERPVGAQWCRTWRSRWGPDI